MTFPAESRTASRLPVAVSAALALAAAPTRFTWRDVRLYEVVLGASIAFWRYPVVAGIPGEIIMMIIVIGFGMFTRPRGRASVAPVIVAVVYAAMIFAVVLVSVGAGADWQQRALRMVLLGAFGLTIAVGRLDWRSFIVGAIIGLLVNAAGFYLHLTPNEYPPFLTGWLADKNVAGLYYALIGLLTLGLFQRTWTRVLVLAMFGALLWCTGSRTSLAGYCVALAWWAIRNRAPLLVRLGAFLAGIQLLIWFEAEFSQTGPFADREGTDLFRSIIHAAERAKVALTPWTGQGLNAAWVDIPKHPHMWFHDSYAALYVEGGFMMLIIMLTLVVIVGLGLLSGHRIVSPGLRAAEGALIVVLVTAWQLGEVFFTSAAFLALGVAWYERFCAPREQVARSTG